MEYRSVEILLASYNGEAYIQEQIDSILQQTNQNWHLTCSDDGSTDRTGRILDDYAARYPDKIARIHSGKKFGNARDHFFFLVQQCRADYMLTCDQDDRWYPHKIERTLEAMLEAERVYGKDTPILVFSDQTPTDAQLNPLAPSLMRYQNQYFEHFDYRSILMQNVVTGGAMCINRALAERVMRFSNPSEVIMHDWWMAVVAARFGKIIYIDESLGDYRQHGSNSVGAKKVGSARYILGMLAHIRKAREQMLNKKRQAQAFMDVYHDELREEDRAFLKAFAKARSGPLFYWKHRDLIHGFVRQAGMMVLG